jgi:nickel superoxide dismutase
MRFRMFSAVEATAHCDLPCGVYDPAQARIEAESVKAIQEKYQANEDPAFRTRAILIKEQRADLVKHHLWVLWTDYFKPPHFEKYPQLHELFNKATKQAGAAGGKGSMDPAEGRSCSTTSPRSTRSSGRPRPPPERGPRPPREEAAHHGYGRRAPRSPPLWSPAMSCAGLGGLPSGTPRTRTPVRPTRRTPWPPASTRTCTSPATPRGDGVLPIRPRRPSGRDDLR